MPIRSEILSFFGHQVTRFLFIDLLVYLFTDLFTSFSGHRPAQRECARTELRSHVRCYPALANPTTRKA